MTRFAVSWDGEVRRRAVQAASCEVGDVLFLFPQRLNDKPLVTRAERRGAVAVVTDKDGFTYALALVGA